MDLMALFSAESVQAFFTVIMIDLLLAGDNAIVIGLAAAGLSSAQCGRAILIGIVVATAGRIGFALVATQILAIVGLLLVGGVLLLWVCWRMWRELQTPHCDEAEALTGQDLNEDGLQDRGRACVLWRAVDDESEVLDIVVQKRRDTRAALKLLKQLLRNQHVEPESIVTDGLASYGSALRVLGRGLGRLRENNRAENSHLPIRRRERKMLGFKSRESAQRFLTTHAAIYNAFDFQRHMISRPTLRIFRARADSVWARAVA